MSRDVAGNRIFGNQVITQSIMLGGWKIEAGGDGIYVTTPDGVRTKVELIDFRETPVPETADLRLPPPGDAPSTEVPGGPDLPGPDSTIST